MSQDIMFYDGAVILEVYAEDHPKRGYVKINYQGFIVEQQDFNIHRYDRDAILPTHMSGYKPITKESQGSTDRVEHVMVQQYGLVAPPKRGDKAVVMRSGSAWFILAIYPAKGGNEPPISHEDDLSIIHRSGSSIRMNDQYASLGGNAEFDGLNGNMTTTANRHMILAGGRFLPFGLLAEHATQTDVNIDLNDGTEGGHTYSSIFDNSEPTSGKYYDPWVSTIGAKKLLSPPDSVDEDTFYLLHQGGGLLKFDPLALATDYSGLKIAAGGFTISVGKKYWDAGLQDTASSSTASSDPDTRNTDPTDSVIRIQTDSGAYIELDNNGNVIIDSASSIKLGGSGASNNVISDADSTSSVTLKDSIFQAPILTTTFETSHNHGITAGQSEVKVN